MASNSDDIKKNQPTRLNLDFMKKSGSIMAFSSSGNAYEKYDDFDKAIKDIQDDHFATIVLSNIKITKSQRRKFCSAVKKSLNLESLKMTNCSLDNEEEWTKLIKRLDLNNSNLKNIHIDVSCYSYMDNVNMAKEMIKLLPKSCDNITISANQLSVNNDPKPGNFEALNVIAEIMKGEISPKSPRVSGSEIEEQQEIKDPGVKSSSAPEFTQFHRRRRYRACKIKL